MNPTTKTPPDEQLWTAEDVARFLCLSKSWVHHQAQAGKIPCIRIGRALRFNPDAVRAFVLGQASSPARVIQFPGSR